MAYVAVQGGVEAIEKSIKLLKLSRLKSCKSMDVDSIKDSMRLLIDQVISESSLYSRKLAAIALK